jgi:hypothetical protein
MAGDRPDSCGSGRSKSASSFAVGPPFKTSETVEEPRTVTRTVPLTRADQTMPRTASRFSGASLTSGSRQKRVNEQSLFPPHSSEISTRVL